MASWEEKAARDLERTYNFALLAGDTQRYTTAFGRCGAAAIFFSSLSARGARVEKLHVTNRDGRPISFPITFPRY